LGKTLNQTNIKTEPNSNKTLLLGYLSPDTKSPFKAESETFYISYLSYLKEEGMPDSEELVKKILNQDAYLCFTA
jgi:hypothetical protein